MSSASSIDLDSDAFASLPIGDQARLCLQLMDAQEDDIDEADESICEQYGREDPRDFIRDVLGETPTEEALKYGYTDPWTPQQDAAMQSVIDHKNTAIPSANGMGKSWLVPRLGLWWLFRHPRSIFVFTAPSNRQVETVLWNELLDAVRRSKMKLPVKILNSPYPRIILGNKWYIIGFSTRPTGEDLAATMFQGFHSEHVMIAYDEAVGVAPEIKDAGDSVTLMPTDRAIAPANPTDPTGWFKEACDSPMWNTVRFDGLDHPNVIKDTPYIVPGAITREWVEERAEQYGSRKAPLYLARVRGQFPDQSTDALIKKSWLIRAQRATGEYEDLMANPSEDGYGVVLGVDVSGEGDDLMPIWAIKDSRLFIPQLEDGSYAWHSGRDTMKGVALVRKVLKVLPDVRTIAIDNTALGGGITARLAELNVAGKLPMYRTGSILQPKSKKIRIIGVSFGAAAWTKKGFRLTKDEMWWKFREGLRLDQILLPAKGERAEYGMPKSSDLIKQLESAIYDTAGGGRIVVYDKRDSGGQGAKKKTAHLPVKSPDNAHSAILAWLARSYTTKLERQPQLTTTSQIFDAQTRELIDKAVGRKHAKGSGPGASAQRRPRSGSSGKPSWARKTAGAFRPGGE